MEVRSVESYGVHVTPKPIFEAGILIALLGTGLASGTRLQSVGVFSEAANSRADDSGAPLRLFLPCPPGPDKRY